MIALDAQYLDTSDPRPIYVVSVGHRIVGVVSREYNAVVVGQIENHVLTIWAVNNTRPTSQEVLGGCGSTHIRQPVLQNLGRRSTQFELCLGLAFTDGAKRL